jgi:4-hydroxymandelate oxidase
VAWLRAHSRLPLLLKGITHPEDARLALQAGADGLIVSNHGGRGLDGLPASAELLPAVVEAVAGRCPVLVDGGIRRGVDVLKALALGARAVLVGRPQLQALAVGGALGVAQMLRLLRDELEIAMALCGCATLADVGPQLLV